MAEELEAVLRLVAEGRLTPDEAAPIIAALTRSERATEADDLGPDWDPDHDDWTEEEPVEFEALDRLGDRIQRRVQRGVARAQRRAERAAARAEARAERIARRHGRGRHLRIRVTERGRQVVNLHIPVGFVETALRFVPGLGGDQADRIRDAVRAGAVGPILDVEDPDGQGGVLISVE
ncbi:MAG TPA: hypothetical protein VLA76_11330 [Candidatus Angelobacter sp.]|nr:hypothetical protein [Candidatus Angelobacter sp.]